MFSILTTHTQMIVIIYRVWEETLGGDRCVYSLGGETSWTCTYPQTRQVVHSKYVLLLHVNHTSVKQFLKKLRVPMESADGGKGEGYFS